MTARFLSVEDAQALMKRAVSLSVGGGETTVRLDSNWTGNLRVARNQVASRYRDGQTDDAKDRRYLRGKEHANGPINARAGCPA